MKKIINYNFPDELSLKDLYVPNPAFREKPEELDILAYFRFYFNCAYYCLVCPYRFSMDPSTKEYTVVQAGLGGKILRVLCLCFLLLRFRAAYSFLKRTKENNIVEYTSDCVLFISIINIFTLQFIIRWRKNSFLRIFELLNKHRHRSFWFTKNQANKRGSWLEGYKGPSKARRTAAGICAFGFLYQGFFIIQFFSWKVERLCNTGEDFWLEEKLILTNIGIDESSALSFPMIGIIYYVFLIYDSVTTVLGDSMFVLTSAMLLHLLTNFLQSLDASFSPRQIVEDYKIIIRVLNMVNETIGPMVLIFVVGATPWFAKCVLRVLQPEDGESMYPFMFLVTTSIYLHLGASVNIKIEQLKTWLYLKENNKLIEPSDLVLILHDLTPGTTGLRGMGFFCISHSFIGSMCGAVVSFCIILIQFNSSQKTTVSTQPLQ